MSYAPSSTSSAPGSGASTPVPAAAAHTQSAKQDKRPALAGVRSKQRKGVAKAQAKFEPTAFRDEFLRTLSGAPKGDYDAVLRVLEAACNELDVRKYETQFYELLIVARLVAPGGTLLTDGAEECPFSVLGTEKENVKEVVAVLHKLIRRYKYLQKPLETASLPSILQYANRLDKPATANSLAPAAAGPDGSSTPGSRSGATTPQPGSGGPLGSAPLPVRPNLEKLGYFTALCVASGLVVPTVLGSVRKDHLVRDGTALVFLLSYLKAYLAAPAQGGAGESMDHLSASLKRGGNTDLLEFFPLQKRSFAELSKEFKAAGLEKVTEWYAKIVEGLKKEQITARLREMTSEEESAPTEDIITYLTDVQKASTPIPEADLIGLIWNGLMAHVDTSATSQQVTDAALKWIKSITPVLAKFTNGARTEIALLNAMQVYVYDTIALHPIFAKAVQLLYNDDVLSSTAIFYWYEKGAKPNGKQTFLKQAAPLVEAIRKSEEDDDEEEDE